MTLIPTLIPSKIDSEQSDMEEQIPSTRSVYVSDKEQAETDVKPSARKNLAARQQSNPELGSLSHCASSPLSNRRSPY